MRRGLGLSPWLVLLTASMALAQTVRTTVGEIDGRVTDTLGDGLQCVSVTIASEALLGTRDTVTSETGAFRFVSITPGLYTVRFDLMDRVEKVKREVQVSAGAVATVNVSMNTAVPVAKFYKNPRRDLIVASAD